MPSATADAASARTERALRWASRGLIAVTWVSSGIFGAYILAHYGGAMPLRKLGEWNHVLPGLYDPSIPLATVGIGLHFAAGGTLLVLGPLQFFHDVRARWPWVHRWVGRCYTLAALSAGVGGLVYLGLRGTIGGPPMTAGFAGYGALITVAAAQTLRHARARRFEQHRAWAIRLFALVIGSWLYRMDYGFWLLFVGESGHTKAFDGRFDLVMDFFFYVPNLIVAELFIRARRRQSGPGTRMAASALLSAATAFLALATYFFVRYEWAPAIAARFSPATATAVLAKAGAPCGPLDCRQYDSLEEAFESTLAGRPRLVAVGEAHAQRGTTVPSSAKHFTDQLLPLLAGRASDLLVELMNPPTGCAQTTEVVRQKQEVVTRSQAPTDQGEYVAMGERARQLGLVPDLLRPTCADLDAVKAAGEDAVPASLAMIARLTGAQARKLLDRDARTAGEEDKLVITYGGAIHNDLDPPKDRAGWSFAPELDAYTGGRFVAIELFVPELIDDSETWKARAFYRYYDRARLGAKTTVFHDGKTFVIILPVAGSAPGK